MLLFRGYSQHTCKVLPKAISVSLGLGSQLCFSTQKNDCFGYPNQSGAKFIVQISCTFHDASAVETNVAKISTDIAATLVTKSWHLESCLLRFTSAKQDTSGLDGCSLVVLVVQKLSHCLVIDLLAAVVICFMDPKSALSPAELRFGGSPPIAPSSGDLDSVSLSPTDSIGSIPPRS